MFTAYDTSGIFLTIVPRGCTQTFPLYACLWVMFVISLYIPGRYIILCVGLYEFLYKFMPDCKDPPMSTRFSNLLNSVPNDDDLDQVYFWERKAHLDARAERQRLRLKQAKLRLVFECQWDGMVKIRSAGGGWEGAYLVVQGHRLVWWNREDDVDEGRAPSGQLLLQGHAGITQASPLEIREIGDDSRLVTVFGRDHTGAQQKKTFLCKDSGSSKRLSEEVDKAIGRRTF